MRKIILSSIVLITVVALGWGVYYLFTPHPFASGDEESATPVPAPELVQPYTNDTYGFSLMMPKDFFATELPPNDSGEATIVLQNATSGVQIVVSPFDEDTGSGYTLTKERIKQDVPDMKIEGEQPLEVGENYKGLAFTSDNAAFGGDSREVWFVYKGHLYQVSTYARLDPLLKAIFGTWHFL